MPDPNISAALKEAYASAPAAIIYHTLELRHPAFSVPIRVVRDRADLNATLETTAPLNPGAEVTFVRFQFDFVKPEIGSAGVPQITIEMDNVSRDIANNIELAITTMELIEVTYREFISTDLSAPQNDPPLTATILSVSCDVFRVQAVAGFLNPMSKRFPTAEYDVETFPGLPG